MVSDGTPSEKRLPLCDGDDRQTDLFDEVRDGAHEGAVLVPSRFVEPFPGHQIGMCPGHVISRRAVAIATITGVRDPSFVLEASDPFDDLLGQPSHRRIHLGPRRKGVSGGSELFRYRANTCTVHFAQIRGELGEVHVELRSLGDELAEPLVVQASEHLDLRVREGHLDSLAQPQDGATECPGDPKR